MKKGYGPELTRRQMLGIVAASMMPTRAIAAVPERVAAIDWAMFETVMMLGVIPVAATELVRFRKNAVEPSAPSSIVDLGLRGSPNLEILYLLRPEIILSSPFYTRQQMSLEAIAPVVSLPFYIKGERPLQKAIDAVSTLGTLFDRSKQADVVLLAQNRTLEELRVRLLPFASRPTYVVNIGDARHFRAFGFDSMFGDVLRRLGLPNAWADRSRYSFAAPVPIEELARVPEARIVIVSDIPVEARDSLRSSLIWNSLDAVRGHRVSTIGNVDPYGGLSAALRFARLLSDALVASEANP